MQPHEPRDEQLISLLPLVLIRGRDFGGGPPGPVVRGGLDEVHEGVVEEHGVAGGAVDDAVEDVGYDFALGGRLAGMYVWGGSGVR